MSKGTGFLLIPAARLTAPEIRELTAAQQTLYDRLHFALHQKNGVRQGYHSYGDLADLCNLHPSTVVEAVKVLVAHDLLLKRNRVDSRSKAMSLQDGHPYLAANAYMLLPPPSIRTPEQQAHIDRTRMEWGQAEVVECRSWRRVLERHAPKAEVQEAAPINSAPINPAPINPALRADLALSHRPSPGIDEALALVMDFHRKIGSTSPAGPKEVALAKELLAQYGHEAVDMVAQYVIRTAQPRSFILMDYYRRHMGAIPSVPLDEATAGLVAQIREMLPGLTARVAEMASLPDIDGEPPMGMARIQWLQDIEQGYDALIGRIPPDVGLRILNGVGADLDRLELRHRRP